MSKQILCCVESNSSADTDFAYIKSTIEFFYETGNNIILRKICMGSKTKYNDTGVERIIKAKIKGFPQETVVIYFIDTDDYDTSPETERLLMEIKSYCKRMKFEFVFFCRDIEDVYWGEQVSNTDKAKRAGRFKKKKDFLNSVNMKQLEESNYKRHCSNILSVLNKHLTKKRKPGENDCLK